MADSETNSTEGAITSCCAPFFSLLLPSGSSVSNGDTQFRSGSAAAGSVKQHHFLPLLPFEIRSGSSRFLARSKAHTCHTPTRTATRGFLHALCPLHICSFRIWYRIPSPTSTACTSRKPRPMYQSLYPNACTITMSPGFSVKLQISFSRALVQSGHGVLPGAAAPILTLQRRVNV